MEELEEQYPQSSVSVIVTAGLVKHLGQPSCCEVCIVRDLSLAVSHAFFAKEQHGGGLSKPTELPRLRKQITVHTIDKKEW